MWSGARKHLAESRPAFSALLARIEADPRVAAGVGQALAEGPGLSMEHLILRVDMAP